MPVTRRAIGELSVAIVLGGLGLGTATPVQAGPAIVLVAGDIAQGAAASREHETAELVSAHRGIVMTAGDNAYPDGSREDFEARYRPSWGRFRARTRPTPGNHDYHTRSAAPYLEYFGWRAGPRLPGGRRRTYYAFQAGAWRVLALDSEVCRTRRGCGPGTPEHAWLKRVLSKATERCTMAVWHSPPWSSGAHGNEPAVRPLSRLLYRSGVELLVTGHDHDYERMAPARPDGTIDRRFGVRQFVVGTGGAELRSRGPTVAEHSRVFQSTVHGVLRLRLRSDGYDWRFLPIAGRSFEDAGSGRCHGRPRR